MFIRSEGPDSDTRLVFEKCRFVGQKLKSAGQDSYPLDLASLGLTGTLCARYGKLKKWPFQVIQKICLLQINLLSHRSVHVLLVKKKFINLARPSDMPHIQYIYLDETYMCILEWPSERGEPENYKQDNHSFMLFSVQGARKRVMFINLEKMNRESCKYFNY